MLKVRIWGSRGSLPASITADTVRKKVLQSLEEALRARVRKKDLVAFVDGNLPFALRGTYGANTSCVEVAGGEEPVLLDAGTGLRDYGNHVMRQRQKPRRFHLFLSHLHWDHLQGFPFFLPAFLPECRIDVYGCHDGIGKAFRDQQDFRFFPVPLKGMQADIRFHKLEEGRAVEVAGFDVQTRRQDHPGGSYGYVFRREGKKIVYSTDSEHRVSTEAAEGDFIAFVRGADLLIFDAQYSLADALFFKENWGHASDVVGVELAIMGGVRHLCFFHTEPTREDESLDRILADARRYAAIYNENHRIEISMAYDGLEIEV